MTSGESWYEGLQIPLPASIPWLCKLQQMFNASHSAHTNLAWVVKWYLLSESIPLFKNDFPENNERNLVKSVRISRLSTCVRLKIWQTGAVYGRDRKAGVQVANSNFGATHFR